MSLTIDKKKLKFSVFGNGFEDDRADSGEGNVEDYDRFSVTPYSMAIDNTETYYWYFYGGLHKFQLSDHTEVAHTVPDTSAYSGYSSLIHPYNVDNNYGVLLMLDSGSTVNVTVFDLTDDSIILQTTYSDNFVISSSETAILVGTDIYITNRPLAARAGFRFIHIDLDAGTASLYRDYGNENTGGFIDSDTIYTYYVPQWFSDYKSANGRSFAMGYQWSVRASAAGGSGYPYANYDRAMCANGQIYCPTYKNGAWRMGVYSGVSPNFNTPKPIRVFGKFKQFPKIRGWCFNLEATKAAFMTDIGLFVTDFKDIELVSTALLFNDYNSFCPMEMSDNYLLATDIYQGKFYVFSI